jgi:hypothetical protein
MWYGLVQLTHGVCAVADTKPPPQTADPRLTHLAIIRCAYWVDNADVLPQQAGELLYSQPLGRRSPLGRVMCRVGSQRAGLGGEWKK